MGYATHDQANGHDRDYARAIQNALSAHGPLTREALMRSADLSGFKVNAGLRWLQRHHLVAHTADARYILVTSRPADETPAEGDPQ